MCSAMKLLKQISTYLLLTTVTVFSSYSCANSNDDLNISVSKGKYKDYYHIQLDIKNIPYTFSKDEKGNLYKDYTQEMLVNNGGQFEILIPVDQFPVPSPNCSKNIILRMPWTNPASSKSKTFLSEKYELFEDLKRKDGDLTVAIELNPYINVVSQNPLKLELKNCNVFFRHSKGKYIDYVGKIKK